MVWSKVDELGATPRSARIAGYCVGVLALGALGGCETTYTHRVSGVTSGNGGATADLVMFENSPVDGEQEIERLALVRDGSRRDAALGAVGDGYVPLGWWEERPAPRIDRPYWMRTSREADLWVVPRPDSRREYVPYWVR